MVVALPIQLLSLIMKYLMTEVGICMRYFMDNPERLFYLNCQFELLESLQVANTENLVPSRILFSLVSTRQPSCYRLL